MVRSPLSRDRSGQATIEYILLVATVVSFYLLVSRILGDLGISRAITRPMSEQYARSYRYGHPKAKGPDDGGPDLHPRFQGGNNFRIFINPETAP
jgi:hypothetical protein